MFASILIFLVALSVLVLAHELGHFVVAKKFGVKVKEFGFGFPPRLFGKKLGETEYTINAIPLGGFVRLKGEDDSERNDRDSFSAQGYIHRIIILVAGILMNFILAWLIFSGVYVFGSPVELTGDNLADAQISNRQVIVAQVLLDSGAATAGIKINDVIKSINNQNVTDANTVKQITSRVINKDLNVTVERGSTKLSFVVTPQIIPGSNNRLGLGVALADVATIKYPWYLAPLKGLQTTVMMASEIVLTIKELIIRLFRPGVSQLAVAGPVGIAMMAREAQSAGMTSFLQFIAILSVNLGMINLLPIPALDGGRLAVLVVSKLRGKNFSMHFERIFHLVGFILLMILVVYVTYNDIVRLVN